MGLPRLRLRTAPVFVHGIAVVHSQANLISRPGPVRSGSLSPGVDGGVHGVDDPADFVFVSAAPDGEVET